MKKQSFIILSLAIIGFVTLTINVFSDSNVKSSVIDTALFMMLVLAKLEFVKINPVLFIVPLLFMLYELNVR